jgi:hypothetical protein
MYEYKTGSTSILSTLFLYIEKDTRGLDMSKPTCTSLFSLDLFRARLSTGCLL